MQLENNILHPNYKRIVIAISIFLAVIVLVILGYQYFSNKKQLKEREAMLREQYINEQVKQGELFLTNFPAGTPSLTDADKKAISELYKDTESQSTSEQEAKDITAKLNQQSEASYQEWRKTQQ